MYGFGFVEESLCEVPIFLAANNSVVRCAYNRASRGVLQPFKKSFLDVIGQTASQAMGPRLSLCP